MAKRRLRISDSKNWAPGMANFLSELTKKFSSAATRGAQFLFFLVNPTSIKEDLKRREFIFNIILLGSIVFCFISNVTLIFNYLRLKEQYKGLPFPVTFSVFLFFLLLYFLSKKGRFIPGAYILITTYFVTANYVVSTWGVNLPLGIFLYILVIVISGILISSKFAFIITLLSSLSLFVINLSHRHSFLVPQLYWKDSLPESNDILVRTAVLFIIAIVSWLSNREIEKSLRRARQSEKSLRQERDLLEIRVEERTKELKQAQMEKLSQMSRFAEIGQISTGMFHDLANPLTAISLSLEQLNDENKLKGTREYMKQALKASEQMGKFLQAVKKQIQIREVRQEFSAIPEIEQAILILNHKAKINRVEIFLYPASHSISLNGNPIKFHQMMTNLISNAIDSLNEKNSNEDKSIKIEMELEDAAVIIKIRDNGSGIESKNLEKIFDPFFTTKDLNKGTGIGLFTVKQTVEKEFQGEISVESLAGIGTIFTIKLPFSNERSLKKKNFQAD